MFTSDCSSPQSLQLLHRCLLLPSLVELLLCIPCFIKNSGEHYKPSNYLPIRLIPFLAKVIEASIYAEVVKHLTSYDLLCDKHHDFHFIKSTTDVLTMNIYIKFLIITAKIDL